MDLYTVLQGIVHWKPTKDSLWPNEGYTPVRRVAIDQFYFVLREDFGEAYCQAGNNILKISKANFVAKRSDETYMWDISRSRYGQTVTIIP